MGRGFGFGLAAAGAGGGVHALEVEVHEVVGPDLVGDLGHGAVRGDEVGLGGHVDPVGAGRHEGRAGDRQVHLARARVAGHLDDALRALERVDARLSTVVECRFFVGMQNEEIAQVLGVTEKTVRRDWIKARAWLHRELGASAEDP